MLFSYAKNYAGIIDTGLHMGPWLIMQSAQKVTWFNQSHFNITDYSIRMFYRDDCACY